MNLFRNLLVTITATGVVTGSAHALAAVDLGTLDPTVSVHNNFFISSSFADIYNFSVAADHRTFTSSAVSFTPSGIDAQQTHVTNLTLTLFSGLDGTGSLLSTASSSNGSNIILSSVLVPGAFSMRVSGIADGKSGGGYSTWVAATPEPPGWMMLLCGMIAVVFMARRKTMPLAG